MSTRAVRIGLRLVAKPVLRASASVEAARWQLRLADRLIPVIADTYVDREFGTGVVKITPARPV